MFESKIRDVFEAIADGEQPPANVSIAAASQRGRSLLRRRRAWLAGAPVLAASVVMAVALASTVPIGRPDSSGDKRASRPAAPTVAAPAPDRLNPLVPYASFGWLPAGEALVSGGGDHASEFLNIYAGRHFKWQLTVDAARACRLIDTASEFECTQSDGDTQNYLAGRAPAVNGHRAFWLSPPPQANAGQQDQALVWQYASNGWAELGNATGAHQSSAILLRIARGVVFGGGSQQRVDVRGAAD